MSQPVPSPCVNICALDEHNICIGCLRSGEEIMRWGKMTNTERRQVLQNIAEREAEQRAQWQAK